jgi:hypothetical protein
MPMPDLADASTASEQSKPTVWTNKRETYTGWSDNVLESYTVQIDRVDKRHILKVGLGNVLPPHEVNQ